MAESTVTALPKNVCPGEGFFDIMNIERRLRKSIPLGTNPIHRVIIMPPHHQGNCKHPHVMGGMFGLAGDVIGDGATTQVRLPILTKPHLRLISARAAFALLAKTLQPRTVWLPSYLCSAIVDAFAYAGTRIDFFPIGQDLQISSDAWIAGVQNTDIVVFIDYFGFNAWQRFGTLARERGAVVVEDACQAVLNSHFCKQAQYVVGSPRKFLGVPDGGVLLAQDGANLPASPLLPLRLQWWLYALRASQLRAEFDRYGGYREWFALFRKTEPQCPIEPMGMSELSSLLMDQAFDYEEIVSKRRCNFKRLATALPEFAIFSEVPDEVVPLGFPVRVHERDRIVQGLYAHEIYSPIHWQIRNIVPEKYNASHHLAGEIMTLPCDQRYSLEDMERLIRAFKSLDPSPSVQQRNIVHQAQL